VKNRAKQKKNSARRLMWCYFENKKKICYRDSLQCIIDVIGKTNFFEGNEKWTFMT